MSLVLAAMAAADARGLRLTETGPGVCTVACKTCGWEGARTSIAAFEAMRGHDCPRCELRKLGWAR